MSALTFPALTSARQFSFACHPLETSSLRTEWGAAYSRRNCLRHGYMGIVSRQACVRTEKALPMPSLAKYGLPFHVEIPSPLVLQNFASGKGSTPREAPRNP
jgi:hypothetical protein